MTKCRFRSWTFFVPPMLSSRPFIGVSAFMIADSHQPSHWPGLPLDSI